MTTNPLTFGSLFAGIGGFDLGFERAGMVCKWQVVRARHTRKGKTMAGFIEMRIAIDIFEKHQCGENRDWGDEDNRKLPIDGTLEFDHDQCWVSLPRTSNNPELTNEEQNQLTDAGWFFDEEAQAWSHF